MVGDWAGPTEADAAHECLQACRHTNAPRPHQKHDQIHTSHPTPHTPTTTAAVAGRRQAARRAAPKMSLASSPLDTVAASLTQQPLGGGSSVVVADYFSTVDEIARGIGDRPWLQYFIPTAVGMSISLAIVFSLYLAAQPYEPPSK